MRDEFNRASFGRGARTPRGTFQLAGGADIPLSKQAKILRASDQVRAKVEKHHAAHQEKWTIKRYGDLLVKAGNSPRPAPLGFSNDPKVAMMSRALTETAGKRTQRLARVERATSNMLASGRVRASRKMNWGRGLGE